MAAPNEIQVGRYNRFVQKLLSIKGHATTYLASPEVDFVVPLFHGAENRYLEGWDLYGMGRGNAAPGAGNFSTLTLRNPVGSNVIAVVVRIATQEPTATAQQTTLFRPGTNGANAGDENTVLSPQGWDGRGRASSTLVLSTNVAAPQVGRVGGVLIIDVTGPTNQTIEQLRNAQDEIPLTPGSLLTVSAGIANESFSFTFWWRERFLEDSERA